MMKRLALSMLMCLTLLSFGTQARAESEMYKFCKHDINTSKEIKAMIGSITMGTILIKGVLATAANVIIINRVN